jgi:hypothetical protein
MREGIHANQPKQPIAPMASFVVKNGSKTRATGPALMPMPVSDTDTVT